MEGKRESVGQEPDLLTDPEEIARQEAANAVRQFDAVLDAIDTVARDGRPFKLRPSTILGLHKLALEGLSRFAGTWRPAPVRIELSGHQPPHESQVPALIEEMCDWVNENWDNETPLTLCAYVMWRLNWIHPFLDGNGRTSRAVSYLVLCAKIGDRLPGTVTIPEQIAAGRKPYYAALEAADRALEAGSVDVSEMEGILKHYLGVQLASTFERATNAGPDETQDRTFH
ncbi:Fic/DOC family protein [Novosphingobium kunmingense]|uniref:Fic/DOC family protein n=1 Tax=Novosphingobium kunmingense TaxID=1211806 RepID=A0A2N0HJK3_9SPHN|nr:Fic family protein [Novosphingobium kunmingense]PKB19121.1 Fic/DOC family protein [Novosphingobium kunmingense]